MHDWLCQKWILTFQKTAPLERLKKQKTRKTQKLMGPPELKVIHRYRVTLPTLPSKNCSFCWKPQWGIAKTESWQGLFLPHLLCNVTQALIEGCLFLQHWITRQCVKEAFWTIRKYLLNLDHLLHLQVKQRKMQTEVSWSREGTSSPTLRCYSGLSQWNRSWESNTLDQMIKWEIDN